jgi:hypothetical protein
MPISLIDVGTLPDDKTGDPNRTCWIKANANFTELYGSLAGKASSEALTSSDNAQTAALNALAAIVAGKPSASDIANKANLAQVCRTDGHAPLAREERLQHAKNSGAPVTLSYRLAEFLEDVSSSMSWTLPAMPSAFALTKACLIFDNCDACEVSAELKSALVLAASKTAHCEAGVAAIELDVLADLQSLQPVALNLLTVKPDSAGELPRGLTLWLFGVWL